MRNLKPYNIKSKDFFKKVYAIKRNSYKDKNYKSRLSLLFSIVYKAFDRYDWLFERKNFQSLNSLNLSISEKSDLNKMYSYRNTAIKRLKVEVTTEQGRVINTCQYCTINEVNSIDHIFPKEKFSEYSVHPKNLFPSCSVCNMYKGTAYRVNNKFLFLNLYVDKLPRQQYLFLNIKFSNNVIEPFFYIANRNNIDPSLFMQICSHYEKLNLLNRFRLNSYSVIGDLVNQIKALKKLGIREDVIFQAAMEKAKEDLELNGHNYWKAILSIELLKRDEFLKTYLY